MPSIRCSAPIVVACGFVLALGACSDAQEDRADALLEPSPSVSANQPPPPAGLVVVQSGNTNLQLWPFTGRDLAGTDADPMNVLFAGEASVLSLRAALLSLDGDRTAWGFPAAPPFDCTWADGFGEVQTAYSNGAGWVANPIQLVCGPYFPLRFHLRLFPAGGWVMGGTHFDLHIEGTTDHQVISWELPEQLLIVDLLRAGILDPSAPFTHAPIDPAPTYRSIPPVIYNAMPDALKALVGLPPGPTSMDVPLPSDGHAVVFRVMTRTPLDAQVTTDSYVIEFDQFVPRPFCSSGPADVLYVRGPVRFEQRVITNGKGHYEMWQQARGFLSATPIDPTTGQPVGPTFEANVRELHEAVVQQNRSDVAALIHQIALPPAASHAQSLMVRLHTGPALATFTRREQC